MSNRSVRTPEVTIDDLADALATGATVVDVREPSEFLAGHVPGALLMPTDFLTQAGSRPTASPEAPRPGNTQDAPSSPAQPPDQRTYDISERP